MRNGAQCGTFMTKNVNSWVAIAVFVCGCGVGVVVSLGFARGCGLLRDLGWGDATLNSHRKRSTVRKVMTKNVKKVSHLRMRWVCGYVGVCGHHTRHSKCSTSPPRGNQVDGLPRASSGYSVKIQLFKWAIVFFWVLSYEIVSFELVDLQLYWFRDFNSRSQEFWIFFLMNKKWYFFGLTIIMIRYLTI